MGLRTGLGRAEADWFHLGENGVSVPPETVRVRGWRGEVGARREG